MVRGENYAIIMGSVLPSGELFYFLRIHFTSVNTPAFDSARRLVHGPLKQAALAISRDARRKCTLARLLTFSNYHTLIFFSHFLPPSRCSRLRFPYLLYFKVPPPFLLPLLPASFGDYKQKEVYSKHVQQPSQPTRTPPTPPHPPPVKLQPAGRLLLLHGNIRVIGVIPSP